MNAFIKFVENNTFVPVSLAESVIEQVGGFEEFSEIAMDVCDHGANVGFSGFIYYSETVKFANENKNAIRTLMQSMADEFGIDGVYSLISGFRVIDLSVDEIADAYNDSEHDENTNVMNVLAWLALEQTAQAFYSFTH